jgi:hypothetical protein
MQPNQVIINGVNITPTAYEITKLFIPVPNATNVGGSLEDSLQADKFLNQIQTILNKQSNEKF